MAIKSHEFVTAGSSAPVLDVRDRLAHILRLAEVDTESAVYLSMVIELQAAVLARTAMPADMQNDLRLTHARAIADECQKIALICRERMDAADAAIANNLIEEAEVILLG